MYAPRVDDERTSMTEYLDAQLAALRASAFGLTDGQARQTPLRSALSIAGILKHICYCMDQSLVGAGRREASGLTADFFGSFVLGEGESLATVLALFDELRREYLEMCRGGDLDAVLPVGPMPWVGIDEPRPAALRYLYGHHVEEFARHAGHADIIREQLDGATAAALRAAVEGIPANQFVTPWTPDQAVPAQA